MGSSTGGGPGGSVTVTVVVADTWPNLFVAVRVYVVVCVGRTSELPFEETVPNSVMVTVWAFSTAQRSVEAWPR